MKYIKTMSAMRCDNNAIAECFVEIIRTLEKRIAKKNSPHVITAPDKAEMGGVCQGEQKHDGRSPMARLEMTRRGNHCGVGCCSLVVPWCKAIGKCGQAATYPSECGLAPFPMFEPLAPRVLRPDGYLGRLYRQHQERIQGSMSGTGNRFSFARIFIKLILFHGHGQF